MGMNPATAGGSSDGTSSNDMYQLVPSIDNVSDVSSAVTPAAPIDFEKIFLVKISRHKRQLGDTLYRSHELESIRDVILKSGNHYRHSSGAWIFVYPEHFRAVLQEAENLSLRPFHIIVTEAWKPLVYDIVAQIRSRLHMYPRDEESVLK